MSAYGSSAQNDAADAATLTLEAICASDHLDTDALMDALNHGADPNWKNSQGTPLLHILTANNQIAAMRYALEAGADPNATNAQGNIAIFETADIDGVLLLLVAGASPKQSNFSGELASSHLPQAPLPDVDRAQIVRCANLLRNCENIENAANNGQLSMHTWETLWASNVSGFPGSVSSRLPEPDSLVYFLHKMEENGQLIGKNAAFGFKNGERGIRMALCQSEASAQAWQRHCEQAGTPMTPDDWKNAGTFNRMANGQKLACLFSAEYWAEKPSLEDFVALAAALPDAVTDQPPGRLHNTISHTFYTWATQGGGVNLSQHELRQFHRQLPENIKEMFSSIHQIEYLRREATHQAAQITR